MTPDREDFALLYANRVRWGECDPQGIVFNVNYFLYFDIGMTEWLRALDLGEKGVEFFTVHAEADYHAPAVSDDMIEIGARCSRLGTKSLTMEMAIFRGGELLTQGSLTYVHADPTTRTTSPLPEEMIERILAFEKTKPERAAK